jgi:hypothetical protein
VGQHPVFEQLHRRAREILQRLPARGWELKPKWDPYLFNEWCEEARQAPGSSKEKAALAIQQAEWELLFAWCAAPVGS